MEFKVPAHDPDFSIMGHVPMHTKSEGIIVDFFFFFWAYMRPNGQALADIPIYL
jgi:hypothetical protein